MRLRTGEIIGISANDFTHILTKKWTRYDKQSLRSTFFKRGWVAGGAGARGLKSMTRESSNDSDRLLTIPHPYHECI